MRGKVLGFHDGSGVIVGDDDQRYSFTLANWRDTSPPERAMVVDFVGREGTADEIYAAVGAGAGSGFGGHRGGFGAGAGAGAGAGMAALGENPFVRTLLAKVRAFPQIPVALLLLLLFFVGMGTIGLSNSRLDNGGPLLMRGERVQDTDVSLAGLNSELSDWRYDREAWSEDVERERDRLDGTDRRDIDEDREEAVEAVEGGITGLGWLFGLAHLFWLIPIAAIAAIAFYWIGRTLFGMISAIVLGVLAIFGTAYIFLFRSTVLEMFPREARSEIRRGVENAFEVGFVGWLIGLLGIAIIVLAILFRRPPAAHD